jgi:predicted ferric reductase
MDSTFNHDVDFYYAVRHRDEVLFYNEVVAAALKNPRLKLHIHYSATSGSLTVDEIVRNAGGMVKDHHIYMCGPYSMKVDFEKRFRSLGVPSGNIHYEEFSLR